MKEVIGKDMFEHYLEPDVIYVVTTNGYVKNNGEAVMGRGTAKDAATLHPKLPAMLGDLLLAYGNRPFLLTGNIVTLPVKHRWDEKADLELIEDSLIVLADLRLIYDWDTAHGRRIYLPRPGCGNGQLDWSLVVSMVEATMNFDNVTVWSL